MRKNARKLGPIHELHIFEDGSFADAQTFPGFKMGFKISGQPGPVSVIQVTPEIKKVLDSPSRHMYRWNHKTSRFDKHKEL